MYAINAVTLAAIAGSTAFVVLDVVDTHDWWKLALVPLLFLTKKRTAVALAAALAWFVTPLAGILFAATFVLSGVHRRYTQEFDAAALGHTDPKVAHETYLRAIRDSLDDDEPGVEGIGRLRARSAEVADYELQLREHEGTIADLARMVDGVPDGHPARAEGLALLANGLRLRGDVDIPGRFDEAVAAYDEALDPCHGASAPQLRAVAAHALTDKAEAIGHIGRAELALAIYDDIVADYDHAPHPLLAQHVARALYDKACTLRSLHRAEEQIAAWQGLVARFGDTTDASVRKYVAFALYQSGEELGDLGRPEEAEAAYDELVARYGDSKTAVLREHVTRALVKKAASLSERGLIDEELAAWEQVITTIGDDPGPDLCVRLAYALAKKTGILTRLGRTAEAHATIERTLAVFANSKHPTAIVAVSLAREWQADQVDREHA